MPRDPSALAPDTGDPSVEAFVQHCVEAQERSCEQETVLFFLTARSFGIAPIRDECLAFFYAMAEQAVLKSETGSRNKISRLWLRLSYPSFKKSLALLCKHEYALRRVEVLLRTAPLDELNLLRASDFPDFLKRLEQECLDCYVKGLDQSLRDNFVRTSFLAHRTLVLNEGLARNFPRAFLWLGLVSAFAIALYIWQLNSGLSLLQGVLGWSVFLRSLLH